MSVTDQDRAAGFKEIRVAMLDGKFEVVCVSTLPDEKMFEIMGQKMSAKLIYQFAVAATGKPLDFILEMDQKSISQIFITVCGLIGREQIATQAAINAGLKMLESAKTT